MSKSAPVPVHLVIGLVKDAIQRLGISPQDEHVDAIYWHLATQKALISKARIRDALGCIRDPIDIRAAT